MKRSRRLAIIATSVFFLSTGVALAFFIGILEFNGTASGELGNGGTAVGPVVAKFTQHLKPGQKENLNVVLNNTGGPEGTIKKLTKEIKLGKGCPVSDFEDASGPLVNKLYKGEGSITVKAGEELTLSEPLVIEFLENHSDESVCEHAAIEVVLHFS